MTILMLLEMYDRNRGIPLAELDGLFPNLSIRIWIVICIMNRGEIMIVRKQKN